MNNLDPEIYHTIILALFFLVGIEFLVILGLWARVKSMGKALGYSTRKIRELKAKQPPARKTGRRKWYE